MKLSTDMDSSSVSDKEKDPVLDGRNESVLVGIVVLVNVNISVVEKEVETLVEKDTDMVELMEMDVDDVFETEKDSVEVRLAEKDRVMLISSVRDGLLDRVGKDAVRLMESVREISSDGDLLLLTVSVDEGVEGAVEVLDSVLVREFSSVSVFVRL